MSNQKRVVTSISIREHLKRKLEDAIRDGCFPAGINTFSSAVEYLIEKFTEAQA